MWKMWKIHWSIYELGTTSYNLSFKIVCGELAIRDRTGFSDTYIKRRPICFLGALLLCPCLFHPSGNVWRSRRASVRALFYCYLTFLDHRTNISRKVRTLRRINASRAPNKFQNYHLDKTNMDKTSQHRFLHCGKVYL